LGEKAVIGGRQVKLLNEHYENEIRSRVSFAPPPAPPAESSRRLKVSELVNISHASSTTQMGPPAGMFDGPIGMQLMEGSDWFSPMPQR